MQWSRMAAGLALAAVLLLGTRERVAAHATYERSDPPAETIVPTAPAVLQVWFTEGVRSQGSRLEVLDAAGNRVDGGDGRVDLNDPDRKRMLVSLPPLPDGVYTVRWVAVSADDDHEASGSFRFGVGVNTVLPPLHASHPAPRLEIGEVTVNGAEVRLHVHVHGMSVGLGPDEGHLHVYVDGTMAQMVYWPEVVLTDVPSGSHEVRVVLTNNAHEDWDPPVQATTTIEVP